MKGGAERVRVGVADALGDRSQRHVEDIRGDVSSIISDSVYTTMTTVDRKGRPRSRALIVVWQLDLPEPVGWLGTFKTSIKASHIANNPHVGTAYWSRRENAAYLDSVASWDDDPDTAQAVWDMYRHGSPRGVGYQPSQFWTGPHDSKFSVLRLDRWRVQVLPARDLMAGKPSHSWTR